MILSYHFKYYINLEVSDLHSLVAILKDSLNLKRKDAFTAKKDLRNNSFFLSNFFYG